MNGGELTLVASLNKRKPVSIIRKGVDVYRATMSRSLTKIQLPEVPNPELDKKVICFLLDVANEMYLASSIKSFQGVVRFSDDGMTLLLIPTRNTTKTPAIFFTEADVWFDNPETVNSV